MILSCQNIEKAFLEKQVLKNCSFHIEDYEKAAIVGLNGAGKTTLLRIIVGQLEPDGGVVAFAKDKTFGYLAQDSAVNSDNTIYEELLSVKQHLLDLENQIRQAELSMKQLSGDALEELMQKYADLTHRFEMENGYAYKSELTGVLKGLGFTEDEFQKPVSTLSGGQKTRVALGKLLLQKPDLIILDEPTNHLDIVSKEVLEDALNHYTGTVLFVSHDRYFINTVATRILDLENQGLTNYIGNYDYYLEKKETMVNFTAAPSETVSAAETTADTDSKLDWKQQKEQQAQLRKKQNELKKVESRIEELENRDKEIDAELEKKEVFTNVAEVTKLSKEKDAIQTKLEELYEKWEELSE